MHNAFNNGLQLHVGALNNMVFLKLIEYLCGNITDYHIKVVKIKSFSICSDRWDLNTTMKNAVNIQNLTTFLINLSMLMMEVPVRSFEFW